MTGGGPGGRLEALGRWCATRPWRVVAAWVLAAVTAGALVAVGGGTLTDDITVPGSQAEQGRRIVAENYPGAAGGTALLVFHAPEGRIDDPSAARAVAAALAGVQRLPGVSAVTDPARSPDQVSPDGDTAFADVVYSITAGEVGPQGAADLDAALAPARAAGLEAHVGGELAFSTSGAATGAAEVIGLLIAIGVLFAVFGTAVAAGLPILVALASLGITTAGVLVAAAHYPLAQEAPQVAAMIGFGVGIDYALILVTRHREELRRGLPVVEAAAVAVATAGRSVLVAGGTVVVAVCALAVTRIPLVVGLGLTAAAVVALSVLAALTLLPAMLGLAGRRVVRRRERSAEPVPAPSVSATDRRWQAWTRGVVRRPLLALLAGTAVLGLLAAPLASIELSMPDGRSTAEGSGPRLAYDLMETEFGPGANGAFLVVAEVSAQVGLETAVDRLTEVLSADPGIATVSAAVPGLADRAVLLRAVPTTAPSAVSTEETLERLRTAFAAADVTGGAVAVTGFTALYADLTAALTDAVPLVAVLILVLSSVLLLVLFRSVVVALVAGLLNLMAIAAAFGVLVAVFQWGWGLSLLGVDEPGPIASFAPIFLFAVVFGLSMDYGVFIIARIREETLLAGTAHEGLVRGVARTAQVITSAALIMVSVFAAFAFAPEPILKLLGLGLAVAVLLDATVVRLLLVPAVFALVGERAWGAPGRGAGQVPAGQVPAGRLPGANAELDPV